jgi:hypothetical protein
MNIILAEKNENNAYSPVSIHDSLENLYKGLEYSDVAEGAYQLWSYPDGTISSIYPDREVSDKLAYSAPSEERWQVVKKDLSLDKTKVNAAYKLLTKENKVSFFKTIRNYFKK